MRITIIILILISNFAFGQNKVSIDPNVVKYEIKDEFNRFDNIANEIKHYKSLEIEFINESKIKIINRYSSGFTGITISIVIDKNMNVVKTNYSYWTDVPEINGPKYKVDNIDLKLNQNPFKNRMGLRGQYTMLIKKINSNGNLIKTIKFKGKFKSFKGVDKTSPAYLWTLEQNKSFYGLTNKNGVFLRTERRPTLKSNPEKLVTKIKKLKGYIPDELRAYVIINEKGKIEKEPFGFFGEFEYLDDKTKNRAKQILIEFTDWYPACVNNKEVKSKIPIVLKIE